MKQNQIGCRPLFKFCMRGERRKKRDTGRETGREKSCKKLLLRERLARIVAEGARERDSEGRTAIE